MDRHEFSGIVVLTGYPVMGSDLGSRLDLRVAEVQKVTQLEARSRPSSTWSDHFIWQRHV